MRPERTFVVFASIFSFLYFFFQAEDGIRDAQESRGLGDVYKRQVPDYEGLARMSGNRVEAILFCAGQGRRIMTCGLSSLHLRVPR